MSVVHHIGVEITEGEFRLAEVRFVDGYPLVLRCDSMETSRNFASAVLHEAPYSRDLAREFLTDFARLLHGRPLFSSSLSFVLPASAPVLETIPIDDRLGPDETRTQLEWACGILGGRPIGAPYQIFTQPLFREPKTGAMLVAAIPQDTINFLKAAGGHLMLEVPSIEIDHFLFESVLCGDSSEGDFKAVMGLAPRRCSASVLNGSRYVGFYRRAVERNENSLRSALAILKELLEAAPVTVRDAGIYGPDADEAAARELRSLLAIPVRTLKPIGRLPFLSGSLAQEAGAKPDHTYSAALYAAMKGAACG